MSIDSVMPSNRPILCYPLLLLPSIFSSVSMFSVESSVHIRWPECWSFSFSSSPSNDGFLQMGHLRESLVQSFSNCWKPGNLAHGCSCHRPVFCPFCPKLSAKLSRWFWVPTPPTSALTDSLSWPLSMCLRDFLFYYYFYLWPCRATCRNLVPRPGLNLGPREWKRWVPTTGYLGIPFTWLLPHVAAFLQMLRFRTVDVFPFLIFFWDFWLTSKRRRKPLSFNLVI